MPGQLQTKDIVKCLLRTIVIPSHVLKKNSERKKMSTSWVRFLYRILAWSTQIWLVTWQDRSKRGGRVAPPPQFLSSWPGGADYAPYITTSPPGFTDLLTVMRWWCNLHAAQSFILTNNCPVTIAITFYVGIMPKPSAPRILNKETSWLWSSTALSHCLYVILKSNNLQYNTLARWVNGTNDLSTKCLMFQVLFFIIISCKILCKNRFNEFSYFFIIVQKNKEFWVP